MAYTPIKTNDLEDVKLSYTTKQTFDILNNNASELDDRADRADAKFEAIEEKLDTIETDATKVEPSQTNGNIIINGTETPVYRLPQLTPSDVGADPAGTAASAVATHNSDENAHSYIQGLVSTAQQKADDAYALAEGRENATSYQNYQAMVTALNAETAPTLKVGDNIYIETVGVPDLWVSDVLDSKTSYTYTTDQAIVDALDNPSIGYVNIGWYRLDELETAKVDLSGYVQKTTTVTGTGALGGGGALSQNRTITHNAGSAPNKAYGLYKISTDAYSHVSVADLVETEDLTPMLDDSYLAKNNPTGTGSFSMNRISGATIGTKSFAAGENVEASGAHSVAFGLGTASRGESSFAVGVQVEASGTNSMAFGKGTRASGATSHAEGTSTQAIGDAAHAEGYKTTAQKHCQHTFGKYNVVDNEDNPLNVDTGFGRYVEIVGNGTSGVALSNARTLDWNGNEVLAGNIKLGNHTTLANNSSSDITVTLPSSAGTLATETYVDNAVGAIDTKKAFTFTANDARWSSSLVDGVYTLTMNASNTTGFVAGKIPFACFNGDNEQVMATLGFSASAITIKSGTKFAGTVYAI